MKKYYFILFCAGLEIVTGASLAIVPSHMTTQLFAREVVELEAILGRMLGFALLSFGIAACRRDTPTLGVFCGLLFYNVALALFLGSVLLDGTYRGSVLPFSVLLHTTLSCGLVYYWFATNKLQLHESA